MFDRKLNRMRGFDYSSSGAYFITICIYRRLPLLGDIVNGNMILNRAGEMIKSVWDEMPAFYPGIGTDEFIVMPDHIHGIINIDSGSFSLPDIIKRYKSLTTRRYIHEVNENGWPGFFRKLWHRSYYDRIIRDHDELIRIREYIIKNPSRWELVYNQKRG